MINDELLDKKLDKIIQELRTTNKRLTQLENRVGHSADALADAKEEILAEATTEAKRVVEKHMASLPCGSEKSNGDGSTCPVDL